MFLLILSVICSNIIDFFENFKNIGIGKIYWFIIHVNIGLSVDK